MNHAPVLLDEAINFLGLRKGLVIADCTVDGGGHAEIIMQKILPGGQFVGIDQDETMIEKLRKKFPAEGLRFVVGNFRNIDQIFQNLGIKKIDGAIFDLGMSSLQLEESGRGFSFLKNEPLLMTFRARPCAKDLTAARIINTFSIEEIEKILKEYGEERRYHKIAKAIIEERKRKPIETTFDLVRIIQGRIHRRQRLNPATKTFQALRIAVNDELNSLREGLEKIHNFISPGGRLIIISFHSLEDRVVKNFMKEKTKEGTIIILTRKPVVPTLKERMENIRSRSAKLRAFQKL